VDGHVDVGAHEDDHDENVHHHGGEATANHAAIAGLAGALHSVRLSGHTPT